MELNHGYVLFTSRLLGFDETGGIINACNQAASDFGIESTRVACLFNFEDFLDPSNNFVRGRVGWFVKVDDTILLEDVDWPVGW